MTEATASKTVSDQTEKKKKPTAEEKKARQREHARAWYERKKASAGKSGGTKNKKPSVKKKIKDVDGLFLYWKIKKDDMFQEVETSDAENDAQSLFMQNPKLEEIYLMQPIKRYSRPVVVVTDL